jgi:glycosyl transferase family 2
MIAFGSAMTSPEIFQRWAKPGILRAAEPDSQIFAYQPAGSIFRSYNLMLEKAGAFDDLEALVLVHQDAEIVDAGFCATVRRTLGDPGVGVVGCVGATGVDSIAWWEGSVTGGSAAYRYGEQGGGEMPAVRWGGDGIPPHPQTGEVETLDGFLLVLSPWTVRNIRFDEALGPLHGFDFDLCMQVRAAGHKVVTADLGVLHHHSLDLVTDNEPWVAAHMRVAEKWDGHIPGLSPNGLDWKERARRAEAEAAAARLLVVSRQLKADAVAKEHERRVNAVTETLSWRITAPLRRLNALRKRRDRAPATDQRPRRRAW